MNKKVSLPEALTIMHYFHSLTFPLWSSEGHSKTSLVEKNAGISSPITPHLHRMTPPQLYLSPTGLVDIMKSSRTLALLDQNRRGWRQSLLKESSRKNHVVFRSHKSYLTPPIPAWSWKNGSWQCPRCLCDLRPHVFLSAAKALSWNRVSPGRQIPHTDYKDGIKTKAPLTFN